MNNHNGWVAYRSIASSALCATQGCFVDLTGGEEAGPNNADNKAGPSRAGNEAGTNGAVSRRSRTRSILTGFGMRATRMAGTMIRFRFSLIRSNYVKFFKSE
jgi:hypothetical protein